MSATTAAVLIVAVALVGFYLLAAYIVYTTGTTAGIADIGRAIARPSSRPSPAAVGESKPSVSYASELSYTSYAS